ncbi:citrate synthase family protein [Piscinibacter terrae]|uniref:Helix-turn-helix domain-containing protein n=1 Tax=Piscinibacter terrae TaxID=2496871 RepID=A0A3N7JQ60_9BURK|nr:citrate synthase family protein [Albitalea terrae]RQP23179.1 helix-turn-helix domain-containing protein [Albitalea terrae]
MSTWMDANEAAECLAVSRQTLYAYVSRGLLRPERVKGSRASRYRAADVQRLALQHSGARSPRQAAQSTLDWGFPVLPSALTLIRDGRLYYRGEDVIELAAHARLEDVAALLWQVEAERILAAPAIEAGPTRPRPGAGPQRSLAAFHGLLSQAGIGRQSESVAEEGAQLLRWMRAATTGRTLPCVAEREPMHRQLKALWRLPERHEEIVRAALVLCADHELNASSFAARCVASTGAVLPVCVAAGLSALSGPRHGGITAAVEDLWDRCTSASRAALRRMVRDCIAAPDASPQGQGFGHPLYPGGDPRAAYLLERLPRDARREAWIAEVHEQTGLRPSIDFALVALRRTLGLPSGAAFALFAIGRTVGWIGHALEQQSTASLIRPRAVYTGPQPSPRPPAPMDRPVPAFWPAR